MAGISKRVSGAWQNTSYGIRGTATDTITTLPTTIYSDGTNATVSIKGNTTQTGTPTPDSPIMPQGTGERTGNLFDGEYPDIGGTVRYRALNLGNGTYTLSSTVEISQGSAGTLFLLAGNVSSGASTATNAVYKDRPITVTAIDGYVTIAYRAYTTDTPVGKETMLNTGETALPFEPYGVKIPISSANTTTPVYLGEVQTTRQIRKYEFTGTEALQTSGSGNTRFFYFTISGARNWAAIISDRYINANISSTSEDIGIAMSGNSQFRIRPDLTSTVDDFKSYLAAQYAAGTPVTVWYCLETAETGIVNEPLMKIDVYADEVNNISIPTTDGANTLSVSTTVQPSEVNVNYHGWHMGILHERVSDQWD